MDGQCKGLEKSAASKEIRYRAFVGIRVWE